MKTEQILAGVNEKNIVAQWDDAHRFTPAPRHRRRLIMRMIADLGFRDCLDAGCAQPFLLREIVERFKVAGFGCDISDTVMTANQQAMPACAFRALDLSREVWPGRTFDLVISSEVLEHIPEWQRALANLVRMSHRHLLITVPSGTMRQMDRMVGHHRHFQGPELLAALEDNGAQIVAVRRWGFPLHSLYKSAISTLSPETLYNSFAGTRYSLGQRLVSEALYTLFHLNDFANAGDQLFVLARVGNRAEGARS
jgi:hypothetical protein